MVKKTSREKLNKLVAKREKLKARKAAGKKTILGKIRAKRIQKKINKNSAAKSDLAKSKVKKNVTKEHNPKKQRYTDKMTPYQKRTRTRRTRDPR